MARVNLISEVDPVAITLCKQGANRKRIFLRKEAGEGDIQLTLPARTHELIRKADGDDWSVFYCVVAEPGAEEDCGLTGDGTPDEWKDSEEIRKAAHAFARNQGYVNLMHDAMAEQGCAVVENAVALEDFTVVNPQGVAQEIKKGSWYIAVEPNEQAKALVEKGEITGVSMEGTGVRTLIEKANQPNSKTCPACKSTVAQNRTTCHNCGAKLSQKAPFKKSVLDRIRDLLASEQEDEPIRKTFADVVAESTIQDSLYDGFDALRMSIYQAFDQDEAGLGDKESLIAQSVNEFRDWLLGIVNAQPDPDDASEAGAVAIKKASGNLRVIKTPEEAEEQMDAKQFEEFRKSQSDAFDRLAGLIENLVGTITERTDPKKAKSSENKDGEEGTNPEDLKKAIEEVGTVVGDRLDQLEAQVNSLAEADSTQDRETVQKSQSEKPWFAGILD